MKVLLTGNKGRIGSRVKPLLQAEGYSVLDFDIVNGYDINDLAALVNQSQGSDVIIHLAAIPHPQKGSIEDYFRVNVAGTFNVLQAAKQNNIKRVVYASSTGYYGCDTNIHGQWRPLYLLIDERHPRFV